MPLYTRRQLLLILLATGAAAAGLGIDHWRRARPELTQRLETLDRTAPRDPLPRPPRAPRRRSRAGSPATPLDLDRAPEAEVSGLTGR